MELIGIAQSEWASLPYGLLPDTLVAQAASYSASRRATFLAGRALLAAVLAQQHHLSTLPPLVVGPHGRPAFADPELPDFNLSHSGDWLWLAFGRGTLGLDVEQQRPRRNLDKLMAHVLSAEELCWVEAEADPLTAFYRLWTLREAVLKACGRGLGGLGQLTLSPALRQLHTQALAPGVIQVAEWQGCSLALYQAGSGEAIRVRQWRGEAGFEACPLLWQAPWQLLA